MTMSNGTQEQRLKFKPRRPPQEVKPDAPAGEWTASIPKGKIKPFVTAAEKGADPGFVVPFKLEDAADEANEGFKGAIITQRVTFYDENDPERRRASNMQLQWLKGLCEACDVEWKDVYPEEINDFDDLGKLIDALEGRRLTIWTVHRKSEYNGEQMINVDIRFKKPGSGLATRAEEGEDDERPGKRGGGKPARRR